MLRQMLAFLTVALTIGYLTADSLAQTNPPEQSRFFHSGDGDLRLFGKKNGLAFTGRYRLGPRAYDPEALRAICRVFDAPCDSPHTTVSLRLIEFLDLLQDRLAPGARMTITSGYRSPQYNAHLRNGGALAAKASLHQYGMAADLILDGVAAKRLWQYAKALEFGGAGYYRGRTVHIDTGPARFWDETTSGVGTGLSDDNKLIGLVTDFDRYGPGDAIAMRFIRMTAFPIEVAAEFALDRDDPLERTEQVARFRPSATVSAAGGCRRFADIEQMTSIGWQLPADLPEGRYRIRARFCENPWTQMPSEIASPMFEIKHGFAP